MFGKERKSKHSKTADECDLPAEKKKGEMQPTWLTVGKRRMRQSRGDHQLADAYIQ